MGCRDDFVATPRDHGSVRIWGDERWACRDRDALARVGARMHSWPDASRGSHSHGGWPGRLQRLCWLRGPCEDPRARCVPSSSRPPSTTRTSGISAAHRRGTPRLCASSKRLSLRTLGRPVTPEDGVWRSVGAGERGVLSVSVAFVSILSRGTRIPLAVAVKRWCPYGT